MVAKVLIEEALLYLEKNCGSTTLKCIHFVVFEQSTYDEFNRVHMMSLTKLTFPHPCFLTNYHVLKL